MIISIAVGVTAVVIIIFVLVYKKCGSRTQQDAITLTNFDGNVQQRIIEDCPPTLSDEEREFDQLVDEYHQVRQAGEKQNANKGTNKYLVIYLI